MHQIKHMKEQLKKGIQIFNASVRSANDKMTVHYQDLLNLELKS